ncbi:MAG TPA: glycosyltransferase [Bacteroidota bacterium]|nr:glycosyltransferase [Bacteroidota bacterium]
MTKKVLIVSYYWPPCGGIGVHRCLKFAKHLRSFGWEPIICTAQDPEYPVLDESNFKHIPAGIEILKTRIWEPHSLYKRMMGKKQEERITDVFVEEQTAGFRTKLGIWIRGNFFIPDARRFWIGSTVKALTRYLRTHTVDALVTNGPPHSSHMIGYHLKQKLNIPWLADFQDPWTQSDSYRRLMLNPVSKAIHEAMEQRVFRRADKITVCSQSWKRDLELLGASNVGVIFWGYDQDDTACAARPRSPKFTMSHYGRLGPDRSASAFWDALSDLVRNHPTFGRDLEINLAGFIGQETRDGIARRGLGSHVKFPGHIGRETALEGMRQSQVLLLIINDEPNAEGRLPGKLFEYLASRRPILIIGPERSEASNIIREVRAGWSCTHGDHDAIKSKLLHIYDRYLRNDLPDNSDSIEQYSNHNTTRTLARCLDSIAAR